MTITEWQALFVEAVKSRQYNIYPAAMVKALTAPETDVASFKALAYIYFAPYESASISSTPGSRIDGDLSPRVLWKAISDIAGAPPAGPAMIVTEQDAPITTEDGKAIQAES